MPDSNVSVEQLNRITSPVIAAAIRIHRAIGPGLLEKAYWACLCFELHSAGRRIETQKALRLICRGVNIDCAYRADLIVEGLVIIEVKALNGLAPIHRRQLLTYLRLANCPLGLLLDFGGETMKGGIKRVVNDRYTLTSSIRLGPAECLCALCALCVENLRDLAHCEATASAPSRTT
jgi:GxxExxY protein